MFGWVVVATDVNELHASIASSPKRVPESPDFRPVSTLNAKTNAKAVTELRSADNLV
ncbi:MAG TPA: hypothetical protein PLN95_01975 [Candidatus Saccharibacteria bacterium]|nr:hypothetical protein [Candidatus Saccharibacteria bacterium]